MIHAFKQKEIDQVIFSAKQQRFSCEIKRLLILWSDPSFVYEITCMIITIVKQLNNQ